MLGALLFPAWRCRLVVALCGGVAKMYREGRLAASCLCRVVAWLLVVAVLCLSRPPAAVLCLCVRKVLE